VLALCPGPTATEFFDVLGTDGGGRGARRAARGARRGGHRAKRAPTQVVETGLRALERDRPYAVDGLVNYLMSASAA